MKILFSLFMFLLSLNLIGQPPEYLCPIDTNRNFRVVIDVRVQKDTTYVISGLRTVDTLYQEYGYDYCILRPFEYNKTQFNYKTKSFEKYANPLEYDVTLSTNKVRDLEIAISTDNDTLIDLSELRILEDLNLSSFESITVKSKGDICCVILNLDKWPNYHNIVDANNLRELKILIPTYDRNFEKQIEPFKLLKIIVCHHFLSFTNAANSGLEHVEIAYPDYFFIHNLINLPLVDYYSIASASVALDIHSYTSRAFFISNLSIEMLHHPLHELDSVVRKYLSLNDEISGDVVLTMSDLYPGRTWNWRGDTLIASGEVKNGVPHGVWTYKLFYSQPENYYFDYSNKESIEFPENGYWTWKYPNGVLAIEGHFKKGMKEGIWKFYDPNGNLTNIKQFKKDRPKGLFTDYVTHMEGGIVEVRTFFSEYNYLKSVLYDGKIEFTAGQYIQTNEPHYYFDNSNGNLLIMKNGQVIREFDKGTEEYSKHIKKYFIKYLFPEFNKGEFPYDLKD